MRPTLRPWILAGALAGALPAAAADIPCAGERASFCSGVEPGDGRIISCLRSRWPELSVDCRGALDRTAYKVRVFQSQCELDLFRFCSTTPNSVDAVLGCLGDHAAELDATCRAAYLQAKGKPDRIRSSCRQEIPMFCGNVPDGDAPGLMACLSARAKELSPACTAAVSP
jgi:Golgi apparatus protein 1